MKLFFTLSALLALFSFNVFSQSGSQTFTSSGTFTVPEGIDSITIEVVGAGGDGGFNGSGGGGGGGYARGVFAVIPQDVLTVTVGIHGQGAAIGTTSVGTMVAASGGENGYSVSNPNIGGGGLPGAGTGGAVNYSGGNGGGGYYTYFGGGGGGAAGTNGNGGDGGNTIVWNGSNCLTPGGAGGLSGGIPGGDGGKGAGFTDNFCNVTDPAAPGAIYGGGGGGGNGNGGGPAFGSDGYCRITYCALDLNVEISGDSIIAAATNAAYQWIDCANGNAAIAGATGQTFIATITGDYAVVITDGPCSDTSECVVVVLTGLNDVKDQNMIMVYENPFASKINLQNTNGNEDYELKNAMGQTAWKGKHVDQEDFSYLQHGVYLLKVNNGNSTVVIRLVKQ